MRLKVTVAGKTYDVDVEVEEEPKNTLGQIFMAPGSSGGQTTGAADGGAAGDGVDEAHAVRAPLSGTVSRIEVEPGDEIASGQVVMVLEAMKMETEITAPTDAEVEDVNVAVGDTVSGGQLLITLSSGHGNA